MSSVITPTDASSATPPVNGRSHHPTKTILITGGAGFIGSNFARYLFAKYPHYRIVVYDALTYAGSVENFSAEMRESDRFEFIYGNICNGAQITEVVGTADIVVHFAAETHVTRSIFDGRTFFETDVLGTANLAGAAVHHADRLERFIHISTSEVYGTCRDGQGSMDEKHPLEPCSPYASAKVGADRLIYSYWRTYGLPAVIVRPFNNYGPSQHLEKVVPRFITSALLAEPLTVHGRGQSARDWLHVEDTCRAVDLIVHAPASAVIGEVFNLGTGVATDVLSIAKHVLRYAGLSEDYVEYIGDRPGQVELHRAATDKIRRVLGWQPEISLEDGIARTFEWYRENDSFWRHQMWMRRIKILTVNGREWH
ncbi:MAG TPA: dTDP-glucose 4,6-dehydratase [Candidatus Dormibacteraeota bacterium]|nr:dTDP-glucose 4,6-dehydratase [Candidatus Dormibacteraeota bacterium]